MFDEMTGKEYLQQYIFTHIKDKIQNKN